MSHRGLPWVRLRWSRLAIGLQYRPYQSRTNTHTELIPWPAQRHSAKRRRPWHWEGVNLCLVDPHTKTNLCRKSAHTCITFPDNTCVRMRSVVWWGVVTADWRRIWNSEETTRRSRHRSWCRSRQSLDMGKFPLPTACHIKVKCDKRPQYSRMFCIIGSSYPDPAMWGMSGGWNIYSAPLSALLTSKYLDKSEQRSDASYFSSGLSCASPSDWSGFITGKHQLEVFFSVTFPSKCHRECSQPYRHLVYLKCVVNCAVSAKICICLRINVTRFFLKKEKIEFKAMEKKTGCSQLWKTCFYKQNTPTKFIQLQHTVIYLDLFIFFPWQSLCPAKYYNSHTMFQYIFLFFHFSLLLFFLIEYLFGLASRRKSSDIPANHLTKEVETNIQQPRVGSSHEF